MQSPYKSPSQASADWSDTADLQRRLLEVAEEMGAMVPDVGRAKQVIEYDSDLRKRALSRAIVPALKGGESYNKAEAEARSNEAYHAEVKALAQQFEAATTTVAGWDAKRVMWESLRSLLSMQKEMTRNV